MQALEDHNEYFFRSNDDSSFSTINWPVLMIEQMLAMEPKNVGVLGPLVSLGMIDTKCVIICTWGNAHACFFLTILLARRRIDTIMCIHHCNYH